MKIRHQLVSPPPLPPPLRASRVSPSENGIHEISATVPASTPHSTLDHLLPPFLPEATPPHTLVSAISSGGALPPALPSLTAEHGPGLPSGIVTVDDASFTTRTKVHSGPSASNCYGLIALPDTGSPQTFISTYAWACMKHSNAASDICEQHAPLRSWGGFGKSTPLLTSTSVRLGIQFLHNSTPSAELVVWACIVPHRTMQHPVLLGRDSTCTTLPRLPSRRALPSHPLQGSRQTSFARHPTPRVRRRLRSLTFGYAASRSG